MNISMILDMTVSAATTSEQFDETPDVASATSQRAVITVDDGSLTAPDLLRCARFAAARFAQHSAVLYLGSNHLAYPVALFGSALAGVPFVPLNFRLGRQQLDELISRHPGALVLRPGDLDELVESGRTGEVDESIAAPWDPDAVAVIIYTSGTTSAPKAALLRHRHLMAYLMNTVEFGGAGPADAALVAVPPYHIAGLTNLLSNLYSGRRVVYLSAFEATNWLSTVRREQITHAMLVPTMLARIVAAVDGDDAAVPTLASLAYGGSRTPRQVIERALEAFPNAGFVNAYGLTETASSIAVLGPEDHRNVAGTNDPAIRERLGSVGRPLPGIEVQIRTEEGDIAAPGITGLVYVRGEQISGEYGAGQSAGTSLDEQGWFSTRDLGRLDSEGYLFIEGRHDDTIIRGGENIAPAEVEDVLLDHPDIVDACVIGVPDTEWGQRLVAVVVTRDDLGDLDPEQIRQWVRDRLRSSKTPDVVAFRDDLPKTETGKLLRRNLIAEFA